MYDDFGPASSLSHHDGMASSPYLSPNNPLSSGQSTVTLQPLEHASPSLTSSNHSSIHNTFDSNADCLRGNVAMRVDDSVATTCDRNHGLPHFMTSRVQNNPLRTNTELSTPMDELIYMQSNFFRT